MYLEHNAPQGRIAPGPRTPAEVAAMVLTSVALPPVAVWHRARGRWALAGRLTTTDPIPSPPAGLPRAVGTETPAAALDPVEA